MTDPRENVHRNFGGQAKKEEISSYVLLPGSKDEVYKIIEYFENPRRIAEHYAFLIYTGIYKGIEISVCSTGIGGTSSSIAIEELCRLGASTFLRLGITYPLIDELTQGEFIIAKGAVRMEGASMDYVRPEFPALASFEVLMAAISSVESLKIPYKVGITGDMASLGPNKEDGFRKFHYHRTSDMKQALYDVNVLGRTSESAMLFIQAALYGLRAGSIHINAVDRKNIKKWKDTEVLLFQAGLESIKLLAKWDKDKAKRGRKYITPEFPESLFAK